MSRILQTLRREDGVTMMLVVVGIVVLSVLSTTMYVILGSEQTRSNDAVIRDASFSAAEAGLHSYMAKLLDDSSYYSHYMAPGESSRKPSSGALVAGSSSSNVAWSGGSSWTYPSGFGNWRALGNGYEYSLQITAADLADARRGHHRARPQGRIDDGHAQARDDRPPGEHHRLPDARQPRHHATGATPPRPGKVYATQDSNGNKYDVTHNGHASADIYAEGDVKGSPTMQANSAGHGEEVRRGLEPQHPDGDQEPDQLLQLPDLALGDPGGSDRGRRLPERIRQGLVAQVLEQRHVHRAAVHAARPLRRRQPTCGTATAYRIPAERRDLRGSDASSSPTPPRTAASRAV